MKREREREREREGVPTTYIPSLLSTVGWNKTCFSSLFAHVLEHGWCAVYGENAVKKGCM